MRRTHKHTITHTRSTNKVNIRGFLQNTDTSSPENRSDCCSVRHFIHVYRALISYYFFGATRRDRRSLQQEVHLRDGLFFVFFAEEGKKYVFFPRCNHGKCKNLNKRTWVNPVTGPSRSKGTPLKNRNKVSSFPKDFFYVRT